MHAGRTRELPLPEVIHGPLKGKLAHVPAALFSLTATRACTDGVCVCTEPVIANCKTLDCTQHILLAVSQIILLLSSYDIGGRCQCPLPSTCQRPAAHNHTCQRPHSGNTWYPVLPACLSPPCPPPNPYLPLKAALRHPQAGLSPSLEKSPERLVE